MMERNWISVKDRLPDEPGWYLVFAPTYSGGSSSGLNHHKGVMFSQLKVTKAGKKSWSIEVGYHERPGCVLYWMPLPIPTEFGKFESRRDKYGLGYDVWISNDGKEEAFQ